MAYYPNVLNRMKKEAEVEYQLLLSSIGCRQFPDPDFLEVFSYKCENQWFRTTEFRLLLIDYRLHVYPKKLRKYLDNLRIERKKAKARAEKNRVKRKYVKKINSAVSQVAHQETIEQPIINFNVKIQGNLD